MLIISNEQFLEELKTEKSKSIVLGESIKNESRKEVLEGTLIPDSIETPIIPDSINLESHTYDNFRKSKLPNIPAELKAVVGALGVLDKHDNVAEAFGISKDTVGTLANDLHSNAEVSEAKVSILHKIKENAEVKINQCVEFVEILQGMNNKELLTTAESLSRIHKNITPPVAENPNGGIQFIFYAPERQNKLEDYEIIDAAN